MSNIRLLPKCIHSVLPGFIAVGAAALSAPFALDAAILPAPPQTFDASYETPSGHTIAVNANGDLQAALNHAQLGDTIILQAGATFTGPFTLPNKTSGSGWIYVQSSSYLKLPTPGVRVSPSDAPNMPVIVSPDHGNAIVTVSGSHHFRFAGIEFKTAANTYTVNVVQLDNNDKSPSTLTHHITFDRCYFVADTSIGVRRGLLGNAAYLAVLDSYFSGFREHGADSQAIVAFNTSGPIKIVNNYLSGAGENLMFGGADSADVSLIPSDIEVRGNYFFKPLSWLGSTWVVKNLLEFKDTRRALVTGNVFENNWLAAQQGFSLLVTPRNDGGTAPWTVTEDIAITNNRFINIGSGISVAGADSVHTSQHTARVLIKNNLLSVNGLNGAHGWAFMILDSPSEVTVDHNSIFSTSAFMEAENAAGKPMTNNFTFINNIVVSPSGLIGSGTGPGLDALKTYFSNWTMIGNALTSGPAAAYPKGNYFPASITDIRFTNAPAGDYSLANNSPYRAAGTDGRDLGADMASIPIAAGDTTSRAADGTVIPDAPKALQVK